MTGNCCGRKRKRALEIEITIIILRSRQPDIDNSKGSDIMESDSLVACPFCHLSLPSSQLNWHANTHFDDLDDNYEPPLPIHLSPNSPSKLPAGGGTSRYNWECKLNEKISCLIGLQTRSEFYKVEGGLMALLRNCLESEGENSKSILSSYVDHFQSLKSKDAGWGCGWRNVQMLSSHLLVHRPEARETLFGGSGFVPDIPSLQRWLEIAWEKGFDPPGSAQFNHVIYDSKKWIGATECAALLRSFSLRARIVDFGPKESQSNTGLSVDNTMNKASICKMVAKNAKKTEAYQVLMDFVWNYFSDESSIQFGQQNVVISKKTCVGNILDADFNHRNIFVS